MHGYNAPEPLPQCPHCSYRHKPPAPRCTIYNGWTNYETWLVTLWLGNDQGTYEYWREQTRAKWGATATPDPDWRTFTRQDRTLYKLSDQLKQEIAQDGLPEGTITGLYADMLAAALDEVHWYAIAEHMLDAEELAE